MKRFFNILIVAGLFLGGISQVKAVGFSERVIDLFPSWGEEEPVEGIIGTNNDGNWQTTGPDEVKFTDKLLFNYIPILINILLKFAAPFILVIFVWAGIRLVYNADNEDEVNKSKTFFMYALMGVIFIVLSYSLLKVVYFLLAP